MTETSKDHIPFKIIAIVILLTMLWGGNIVAIKISLQGVPPFTAAGIRFLIALIVIGLWGAAKKISLRPTLKELSSLIILGVLLAVQISFLNWGTSQTAAGRATVIHNTYPIFITLLAHFIIPGDKLNYRKIAGLFLAFGGILLVFWDKLSIGGTAAGSSVMSWLTGDLLCLGSGFTCALITVLVSKFSKSIEPVRLLFWEMFIAVLIFLSFSVLFEGGSSFSISPGVVTALLYQGAVVSGFCFLSWTLIIRRYSPGKLAVFFFSTPIWGLLFSYILLGEKLNIYLGIGAVLVGAGSYLVNLKLKKKSTINIIK